jgi:phosphatidylinositol alpha-mannosyltransferase
VRAVEPLSIALVYDDSLDRPGGVAQHVEMLRRGLTARGHQVHLLVGESRSPNPACRSLARNVAVRFNGNRLTVPLLAPTAGLEKALFEISPDVLHVQMPYSPLLAGRLVARAHERTAVVGTSHVFSESLRVRLGARLLAAVNARTSGRFDRVLAVSQAARSFAERHSRMRVDAVVPNMVDIAAIRALARGARPFTQPTVVFIGSLVPRKGVDCLVAAWPAVLDQHPEARLIIAGDGPRRQALERLARQTGIGRRVRFLGLVDEAEKARLLAAADVACFPSLYGESFGIVMLEAMAIGTPVVLAGDNVGYRELLEGRHDALVNARRTQMLARALAEGLSEAEERELRQRWQARLAARHDLQAVTDEVLEQYHQALALRRDGEERPDVDARVA